MQTSLFETEKEFTHKTRGKILTDKIWKELDVHSKINIKVAYGYGEDLKPNYWIIDNVFECGLDMYQLLHHEARYYCGYLCFQAAPPSIKPI